MYVNYYEIMLNFEKDNNNLPYNHVKWGITAVYICASWKLIHYLSAEYTYGISIHEIINHLE